MRTENHSSVCYADQSIIVSISTFKYPLGTIMCIQNWVEALSIIILLFTAIILLFTAIATCRSARAAEKAASETNKSTQASLIASLFDTYSSSEMLDAIQCLYNFKTSHGDNFCG